MTRKDFNAIAEAFRFATRHDTNESRHERAAWLAAILKDTNPAFDTIRFIEACMA